MPFLIGFCLRQAKLGFCHKGEGRFFEAVTFCFTGGDSVYEETGDSFGGCGGGRCSVGVFWEFIAVAATAKRCFDAGDAGFYACNAGLYAANAIGNSAAG